MGARMVTHDWSSLGISIHHACNPTYSKIYFMTSTFASIFINLKYFLKMAYIHSLQKLNKGRFIYKRVLIRVQKNDKLQ